VPTPTLVCNHNQPESGMYYYISFLRPPPNQVSPTSKNILITPQVANDLRTELFHGEVDLFLSWVPCAPGLSSTQQATRPGKLTTWKPATAYKEIPLSMPPGVREGQTWKLVLSADSSAPVDPRIPLFNPSCGSVPFPVISMPILFSSRGLAAKAGSKQERIQRVLSLGLRHNDGTAFPSVMITEQTSFDLDKVGLPVP
jgi:protein N-lysine methyltransferase METTL21D